MGGDNGGAAMKTAALMDFWGYPTHTREKMSQWLVGHARLQGSEERIRHRTKSLGTDFTRSWLSIKECILCMLGGTRQISSGEYRAKLLIALALVLDRCCTKETPLVVS